ncbi:MAG: ATP-binding protein, partial [Solirubrobacteraceae bacterium]
MLDRLVDDVRAGRSGALVVRGEPGVGKSELLAYLAEVATACRVARAAGVQSEMELTFAGLHQLCAPMLEHLERLPNPQRDALGTAFGVSPGPVPDRFVVSLAVLNLLSDVAAEQPLVCLIDDAQWLDRASAQVLGFVARRLGAESVAMVFGRREPAEAPELAGLPELTVEGLADADARELLGSVVQGPLDEAVRDRIIAETRGNPLALLELPRSLTAAELAGGFGTGELQGSLPAGVVDGFRRRLEALPEDTRQLLLLAAAEPVGEPVVVWRAAGRQGISAAAAEPATEAGLCEFGARIRFRHPLVRAVAYGGGSPDERRRAHAALAEATDADADPDRRAWHRAHAAAGPDDAVADELERSTTRARSRGGVAAAAAFLERSAHLTLDPRRGAERAIAAGEAQHLAGSADAALRLAALAERGPLDELQRVRVEVLRAQVATMQRRGSDAPPLLLRAARRLERFDRRLARETYREALGASFFAGGLAGAAGLPEVSAAVGSLPRSADHPSVTDDLLDAGARLIDAGYAAGAPAARGALAAFRTASLAPDVELRWAWLACRLAHGMWDDEAWDALSTRLLEAVRGAGVLALLPTAVAMRVGPDLLSGDLAIAAARLPEHDAVVEAIGGERSPTAQIALAAFRGDEAEVARLDAATTPDAVARGEGQWVVARHWATAVLYNGLGRYGDALVAAQQGAASPPDLGLVGWA